MTRKSPRKKRRSAIVPAVIFSVSIGAGLACVPLLSSCGGSHRQLTVAQIGFDMSGQDLGVSVADFGFTVAATGFDMRPAVD